MDGGRSAKSVPRARRCQVGNDRDMGVDGDDSLHDAYADEAVAVPASHSRGFARPSSETLRHLVRDAATTRTSPALMPRAPVISTPSARHARRHGRNARRSRVRDRRGSRRISGRYKVTQGLSRFWPPPRVDTPITYMASASSRAAAWRKGADRSS